MRMTNAMEDIATVMLPERVDSATSASVEALMFAALRPGARVIVDGSASVLPLCAPPIHGPSPGRAVQPPAPRAMPRTMAVGRTTGRSQLQIVKFRSPSRTVATSRAALLAIS